MLSDFMTGMAYALMPIFVALIFALISAVVASRGFPDTRIFLLVFAICMAVLTAPNIAIVPSIGLVLVALPVAAIWFGGDRI